MRHAPVQVWIARARPLDLAQGRLPDGERARLEAIRSPVVRDLSASAYLLAQAAARLVLARSDAALTRRCPACGAPTHGPLSVVGGRVDISVSYSGDLVLVAASSALIGVDLQVAASGTDAEPHDWARYEAAVKATHAGLAVAHEDVRWSADGVWRPGPGVRRLLPRSPTSGVVVRDVAVANGYRAAIAALDSIPEPTLSSGDELLDAS